MCAGKKATTQTVGVTYNLTNNFDFTLNDYQSSCKNLNIQLISLCYYVVIRLPVLEIKIFVEFARLETLYIYKCFFSRTYMQV